MKYKAKLSYRTVESVGTGDSDHAAIQDALKNSVTIREAHTADVALVLFHSYSEHEQHVSYATTLNKYNLSIS